MGDRLFRTHREHFRIEGILDRLQATGLVVEVAEVDVLSLKASGRTSLFGVSLPQPADAEVGDDVIRRTSLAA